MKKRNARSIPRRTFIGSGVLLGHSLLSLARPSGSSSRPGQSAKPKLSSEEKKWVQGSILAKELENYFGQGYSCAESLFMVSLRYLGKPEEWVWMAAGFGGGMQNRDLCGFLTAGIMALGCASGMLEVPRNEAKGFCQDLVKEYWNWWGSMAAYRCEQIRTQKATSAVCMNQGLLSAAKLEDLLSRIREKDLRRSTR